MSGTTEAAENTDPVIRNAVQEVRDANSRTIFKDHVLTCQFLQGYTGISLFENIQPEDIEDVTDIYQAFLGVEFETDTVKRVRVRRRGKTEEIVIPLIEHKTYVDYDVAMQVLRYMAVIWYEYAKEADKEDKEISHTRNFRYPLIVPIVYYEGKKTWTAERHLSERIADFEEMKEYIPDFTYILVNLQDYTNEKLQEHKDEMSLVMMFNKIQSPEEFHQLQFIPKEYVDEVYGKAPNGIKKTMADILWSLFMKMNLPLDEARANMKVLETDGMGRLFENMDKMDIQEERENTRVARKEADKQREEADKQTKKLEQAIKSIVQEKNRGNQTKDQVKEYIRSVFGLDEQEAKEKVELYWH